jgi:pantoate--beta-alanine ligase
METVTHINEVRTRVAAWRGQGERIALVPTMGNLHAGHAALVKEAQRIAARVVVSIFINPLQFGPNEDFGAYPRTMVDDQALLQRLGADLTFAPAVDEMYPRGQESAARVEVPKISDILCGQFRPGHFIGVATVVNQLFNIVQPDVALFGEKDFQQLAIIRRLVADLHLPLEIIGMPTLREPDGLAMSSRNRYLTTVERAAAPQLYALLQMARQEIELGKSYEDIMRTSFAKLTELGFKPDYFEIRDANTLASPTSKSTELVVLTAARLGRARLIDNIRVKKAAAENHPRFSQMNTDE